MATPRVEKLFTAVDLGSSKVSALIAGLTETGDMMVLGSGQRASEGIKRGYVVNLDTAVNAVCQAVEQAERMAGVSVRDVWVGCSGAGLVSDIASVEVEVGGGRVEQDNIDDLLAAGRDVIDPNGRMILHAQPALYILDGQHGVAAPKGLHADRLGVDIHVVLADGAPIRNIDQCIARSHLNLRSVIASPMAASLACLEKEERELGVAMVEFGAAVTNVSLYVGNMLAGLYSIPYGSGDMTDAIASCFSIKRHQAERLKCVHGTAIASRADHREMVPVISPQDQADGSARSVGEQHKVGRAELVSVITQQLDYLLGEVGTVLKRLGFAGAHGHRVVFTGGGAELTGLAEYAQGVLGRSVRIGRPPAMIGLAEPHATPAFSTLAGLALYAHADPVDIRSIAPMHMATQRFSTGPLMPRLMKAVRDYF